MRTIHSTLFILLVLFSANTNAQTPAEMSLINPVAIGLRMSPDGGMLSGKVFLDRNMVIEALVGGSQGYNHATENGPAYGASWTATVLDEYHFIFQNPSWRIYLGAGLHMGKWDKYDHADIADAPRAEGIFGVDAIVGVEYVFRDLPIGISADVKPAVNIDSYSGFFPNNLLGVAFRYYFGRKIGIRVEEPKVELESGGIY